MYVCHLQIVRVLILPFQFKLLLFLYLIAAVRTANTLVWCQDNGGLRMNLGVFPPLQFFDAA